VFYTAGDFDRIEFIFVHDNCNVLPISKGIHGEYP